MSPEEQFKVEMPATYEELAEEYIRLRKRFCGLEKKSSKAIKKLALERGINNSDDNGATLVRELYEENTYLAGQAELWKKRYQGAADVLKEKLAELGKQHHQNNLLLLAKNLISAYEEKLSN